ncbi:MAG: polysaccharide deacetylase family protein [Clostridia bacterium]
MKKFILVFFFFFSTLLACNARGIANYINLSIYNSNIERSMSSKDMVQTSGYVYAPKYVALTFDDGPSKKTTPLLLEFLKENDVTVTFFLLGENISGNEEILRNIKKDGHEIGVHSYTHKLFTKIKNEKIHEQISSTNELIYAATSSYASIVRPPYGSVNKRVKEFIKMPIILWNVDSLDWKYRSAEKIYSRVIRETTSYDIILMHDIFPTSVEASKLIIQKLKADGYTFVTVSKLNELKAARDEMLKSR